MAELISIRVFLFFVAFFALRPVMFALIPRPNRAHGLGLLGVSTLIAFLTGAFVLGDGLARTLVAWAVIYAVISLLWFLRWRASDNEEKWRRMRAMRDGRPDGQGGEG